MMKRFLNLIAVLLFLVCMAKGQTWVAPIVPAENLKEIPAKTVGYLWNVDADAFVTNGMNSNVQAIATRLTNGDQVASVPHRVIATVSNDTIVSFRLESYNSYYLACPNKTANNVYVNRTINQNFVFKETAEDSRIYVLNNKSLLLELDVAWNNGGPLTLKDGSGKNNWAFIKESAVTDGSYARYKARKQLFNLYEAITQTGKASNYKSALETAYKTYIANDATVASITEAARTLFFAAYADIAGPIDVSFLLNNADMVGSASTDGWNKSSSNVSWSEFEKYHTAYTLEQTTTFPVGNYDFGFRGLYREDGSGKAPAFIVTSANKITSEVPLMSNINFGVTNTTENNWSQGPTYIQPNGMKSCGQALTHNEATAWAKGVTIGETGEVNIQVSVNTSSQWFNWQGFTVIYQGVDKDALLTALTNTIEEATTVYGDGTGKGASDLKATIDAAQALVASLDEQPTNQQLNEHREALLTAINTYRNLNASTENPIDRTGMIMNPSFEDNIDGWLSNGMNSQGNTAFSIKQGNVYVEKWTGRGNKVGDASITQIIKNLDMGIYQLKVAAQNIQEDSPSRAQTGAWIIANNAKEEVKTRKQYTLTFTNIETDILIGFLAEAATGNWIACDNFRLYYIGGTDADFCEALTAYIDNGKQYVGQKMHTATAELLNKTIEDATAELTKDGTAGFPIISTPLRNATEEAVKSIKAFQELKDAIEDATTTLGEGTATGADDYRAAIEKAQTIYDDGASTYDALTQQIKELDDAKLLFLIQHPTGAVPVLTTDKRFARGATMAFGRFTIRLNGAQLMESGFCYATKHEPTIFDGRSTRALENNGKIYVMENLTPATIYYARPYVLTKGYQVVYGDEIKIITIPKGNMTYWYNNGGSAEENERINYALKNGTEIWNNLMNIQNMGLSVSYGSGTPTADCSYGGSMRVGPNAAYQRTGTIMHEAAHGVGVGTQGGWWGLLVNGTWTGDRANAVLQFWDNDNSAKMRGDSMHMWPYGINGAHEDSGTDLLYYANALIIEGLHEDGVAPTSSCFASPAYTFYQEDTIKYYLKNENAAYGLNTSYLQASGTQLKWTAAASSDVTADDSYAWYLTFDPKTQFYAFKNAGTGAYITYSSGSFRTAQHATPVTNDKFQLMRSREDLKIGSGTTAQTYRGYWILKANGGSADAMTGAGSGTVSSTSFYNDNSKSTQRWLILTAEETVKFDESSRECVLNELDELIAQIELLKTVPHTEDVNGTDEKIETSLTAAKAIADNPATSLQELREACTTLRQNAMDFLGSATPVSAENPFDITFMLKDASIKTGEGWEGISSVKSSAVEYYENGCDLNQTILGLPKGTYKLMAQAFNRPGRTEDVWKDFQNGKNNVVAYLYAGSASQKVCHLAEGASKTRVHNDDLTMTLPTAYVPCTISSAVAYFAKGTYDNELLFNLEKTTDLKVGVRQNTANSLYWTMVDNFRLYSYGSMSVNDVTAIESMMADQHATLTDDIYTIQGFKVNHNINTLPKGVYIINGKKVTVK